MSSSPVSETGVSDNIGAAMDSEWNEQRVSGPISLRRRLRRRLWHIIVRQIVLLSEMALVIAGWLGRRRPVNGRGCEIILTGRFDSDNWILAHLGPLSASKGCSRVWMVSNNPVPALPKVTAVYPPVWLVKIVGAVQARLLVFTWLAIRKRPHVVGGFHLSVNGIVAVIVGCLVGARSMYFCVGGPTEVRDGGIHCDDNVFAKMETVDAVVEKRLLKIISKFDTVITMGTKAVDYFREKGINADFHVVSGGIDSERFQPAKETPSIDIILTGRLVTIKRIDIFLQAVKCVAQKLPDVKAVIVGDGVLRDELQTLSKRLGIDRNVTFAGRQYDVENWLRRARVFVLTSDSEGLSLSMMEAMMCGLPVVVSDVGDLADLIEDGFNGYLVPRRSSDMFARRLVELLSDERRLGAFSLAARHSALKYETNNTIQQWDNILNSYCKS